MTDYGTSTATPKATTRIDWVDYAKGICIVMVVMMHSTLGSEIMVGRHGFMHWAVEFAKPFRMPDFFLISGLFLALVINRDWRTYLDRKVVHFFYFYILWVAIQFAFKAPVFAAEFGWVKTGLMYLETFYEPFGTLWFIYMLPLFFIVTKATMRMPALLIWLIGAALEMANVTTGWTLIDEFAGRFVYFYSGYLLAGHVFKLAAYARAHPRIALSGLAVWFVVNASLVFADFGERPVISLVLGFAGAGAIIVTASLLAKVGWLKILRVCGEHSLVVYLAFFLPMAISRTLLIKTNLISDIGTVSLVVTICGVFGAYAVWWWAKRTGLTFLFERPTMFWIAPKKPRVTLQAAE